MIVKTDGLFATLVCQFYLFEPLVWLPIGNVAAIRPPVPQSAVALKLSPEMSEDPILALTIIVIIPCWCSWVSTDWSEIVCRYMTTYIKGHLFLGLFSVDEDIVSEEFLLATLPPPWGALRYPPPTSLFLLVLLPFWFWLSVTFLDSSSTRSPSRFTLERVLWLTYNDGV